MSEEDVKIKFLVPYLEERGYTKSCMDFEVAIEVHEGRKKKTIFADVLVYASPQKKAPLLLCETKSANEPLNRNVREQAISYARLLNRIAPLVLITNGSQVRVFHSLNKARIAELPRRSELDSDIVKFVLSSDTQETLRQEAKHELFIIDDVRVFKSVLKACHNEIRNNEGLDPTAAFDEMSKVMFCKLYEEKENSKGNRFRLSIFDDSIDRLGINVVHKILEDAMLAPGYRDLFSPDVQINLQDRTIRKIVGLFENYDLGLTAFDVKGEAFEYFLGDTFTGGLGEYFTPRNIVEFIVEVLDPKIGDTIIDPFCGTGGFLIYAFELVSEKIRLQEFAADEKKRWRLQLSNQCLFGTDWKERTSQACKMNMMVHGDGSSGVFMHDGFIDVPDKIEEQQFDLCLTNPPFGSFENNPEVLNRYELGQGRKSQDRVILALERCIRLVKPEGLIGIVVIDGVLNNKSTKYVRDYIRQNAKVLGVVSLNKETFEGYGSRAKTSILFLQRKSKPDEGDQEDVFMVIARNTGLAPNGDQVAGNVLPDVLMDFQAFRRGKRDFEQHSECWVSPIQDRFDAEFYASGLADDEVDVASVRGDVEQTLREINAIYQELESIERFLEKLRVKSVTIGDLLEEVTNKERVTPEKIYALLGVRWWGEGVFIREKKLGAELKAKTVKKVSAGWLIYNRLFAYRGSFAVTGEEHEGCYVSNEFPTFRSKDGIESGELLIRYTVHCLNSPQYLAIIDAQSTGSTKTSRNRFNQKHLLDLPIQIPVTPGTLSRAV